MVEKPIKSKLLSKEPELVDFVKTFIIKLPAIINELEGILASGDLAMLNVKAHDLKGSGGGFGFDILSDIAEKILIEIEHKNVDAIHGLLLELRSVERRIVLV